jgi:ribosomal protein S18 acetylase RimI-like enzyme
MIVELATVDDAGEILALQKLAYRSEAAIYDDYSIPPLTQTLDEIRADFDRQTFLKIVVDGAIAGSVRAYLQDGTCYIGRLIVHPDRQNRGLGTRLLQAIEQHFDGAERYELFTGHKSERNLYLYQKLGYTPFSRKPQHAGLTIVFLEKRPQPRG